jgi:hypothetical protein
VNRLLHLDFEFYSPIDIKAAPLDVYASHPDARILLAAYGFDDGPVKVWETDSGPCRELRDGLTDPGVTVVAWNVGYERQVLASKGLVIPNERFGCNGARSICRPSKPPEELRSKSR